MSTDETFDTGEVLREVADLVDMWSSSPDSYAAISARWPGLAHAIDSIRTAWNRPERPDVPDVDVRREEEWAVFCGVPDDGYDLVRAFDARADAEELAQRVIDAHIAHRTVTISEPPWEVVSRCSACGSVIDGELCCDGRRAEIEAGEAVLREVARRAVLPSGGTAT